MSDSTVSSISKSGSIEEISKFWDSHSLADYENEIEEVEMEFDPSARRIKLEVIDNERDALSSG